METSAPTDAELRHIAELSIGNRQDEAGAMLAEIGTRAEDEFRRAIRKEIQAAKAAIDAEYSRRIIALVMIIGLLAGLIAGGMAIGALIYYLGVSVSIPAGSALTFICAAIGAFIGWYRAK
jgi:hypothetical protein